MPFDPYMIRPFTIPEEVFSSGNLVTLTAHGDRDSVNWSISLSDPTLQLPVSGTLRIDPSMQRSQAVEIAYSWIISECKKAGLTVTTFEDKGGFYEDPRYESFLVEFQVQRP
ncbi:MAG TPA: hypothetical protein VFT59_05705 [Candidatus Saccharimonadales bacterium]|nr:hypothetical protein [Candidatus Saccharimonadales bacterium]